jgi:hypothetical protein
MLSQDDRQRLKEIEQHLLADDPKFVARMRSERPFRLSLATRISFPNLIVAGLWMAAFAMALASRSMVLVVALLVILVIEAGWRLYQRARRRRLG